MTRSFMGKVSVSVDLLFIIVLLLAVSPGSISAVPENPVTGVTLSASPVSPQLVNTPVIFTATATGGGAYKEYSFAVRDPVSGLITVMQPYGSSNSFHYTPTNAGTYSIRVFANFIGSGLLIWYYGL